MPAYLLVLGKAADRDRMAAYSRALPPIYSKYRGRYLALGGAGRGIDWLAGPVRDRSLVLARFDAFEDVLTFWWSEEYRAAARLRERAGQFTVLGLPGEAADPARDAPADAVYLIEATITRDALAYDDYVEGLDATIGAHGGRALVRARLPEFTALEGDALFDRMAVTFFPSRAALDACLADPRADAIAAARERAGLSLLARATPPPRA